MSDDDDDVAIPKGKIIARNYMPSKQRSFQNFWYIVSSQRCIS